MSLKMKLLFGCCVIAVIGASTFALAADDELAGLLEGLEKPATPAVKPAEVPPPAEVKPEAPATEPAPVTPTPTPEPAPATPAPATPAPEAAPAVPAVEPAPATPAPEPAPATPAPEAAPAVPAMEPAPATPAPATPAPEPAPAVPATEPAPATPAPEPAPATPAPATPAPEVAPAVPAVEPAPATPAPATPAPEVAPAVPAVEPAPATPAPTPAPATPAPAAPSPAGELLGLLMEEPVKPVAEVKPVPEVTPVPEVKPVAEVKPVPEVTPVPEVVPAPEVKPVPEAVAVTPATPPAVADEKSQIVSELNTLETIRLKSMDDHGYKLLAQADKSFKKGDYMLACEQYKQSQLFIVNRPFNTEARKRAADGEADSYYREAYQLFKMRELAKAKEMANEAHRRGHPNSARLLELIKQEPEKAKMDSSSISHRLNEATYKAQRDEIRKRLRKSRQYFTTAEYAKAIEECELVLRDYPGDQDAIALRKHIAEHMKVVADSEFEATRETMIKDVVKAWTPDRYAPDSPQLPTTGFQVVTKAQTVAISDTKSDEQMVSKKLKKITIPEVTFRPPATIVDAIDFFKQASIDYDDPEIPLDQRGVNLILKLPQASSAAPAPAEGAAGDVFASAATASTGIPSIPAISARFLSLFDSLKLVCDVTGMKFRISGKIVMIVPMNDPDQQLVTRNYNVLSSLTDRITSASAELRPVGGGARADGEFVAANMGEARDEDKWKLFFQQMGVKWPIGSSVSYLATIGKLRVTNTQEELAMFEQVLEDLNVTPRLVEIETRFVEVSQNDLNSLGFEWLLNGDFSWSASGFMKNALDLENFSNTTVPILDALGNQVFNADGTPMTGYAPYTKPGPLTDPFYQPGQYGRVPVNNHNMGMNAIDGTPTGYSTGNRYLNTLNNPVVGEGAPINDKFMRLNAFIGGADVSMILHMLCQRSDTDVLSAPKVTTKSGQEAIIKVVTEYIYPSEFNVQISQQGNQGGGGALGGGGGTGEPIAIVEPQNFVTREVGVILQVVPEVSSEGQMINLTMKPQVVSEPVWKNYGTKLPKTVSEDTGVLDALGIPITRETTEYVELPMEQPFFTVRSVETQLLVYNGATVVMGGLITEQRKTMEDKIPFLGDIPYLGRLFRSRSEKSDKRNLLIFVTARLVDPGGRVVRTSGNESSILPAPGMTPTAPSATATPEATPPAQP
jgi:general secretion pathway protein D